MGIEIKTQCHANLLKIADRNGLSYEIKFDKNKNSAVQVANTHNDLVTKAMKLAENVHNHFLVSSYSSKDVKNAVQFLEMYLIYEWFEETARATDPSLRDEASQSKKHMKTINSLEDLHAFVDLPDNDQRKSYISKCKTTAKQIEKIFNDDVLVNKLAFQKPVLRAIKVLTDYHKKLT